jgi:D-beta-D-heptose 7-phosphate kinase/D-beta-D-heptose 1-phosphate adenosyltransferase
MTPGSGVIERRLAAFARRRVLVVGDSIVDVFTRGTAIGIAAETPTLVIRREGETRSLGGAAFLCRNLLELGARVDFVTLAGEDAEGALVRDFAAPGLDLVVILDPGRPTTVKQRFEAAGHRLLQLDVRDDRPVSAAIAARVKDEVLARLAGADALVVSDYRHGLLPPDLAGFLVAAARHAGTPIYVDSQVAQTAGNHADYHGGAVFCLNLTEARGVDPGFAPLDDPAAWQGLWRALEPRGLVVKLGAAGAALFDGAATLRAPALPGPATDVTGAGDAFLAALVLAGLDDPAAALAIANAWAGLSVRLPGTATPKRAALAVALGQARGA